jgi:hypothetical protein
MRDEVKFLLERQAAWQRSRAKRPWSEKLRAAVAMRRGLIALRNDRIAKGLTSTSR